MTPEERWTKIEQQTAENQKQIARISEQMERKTSQIDAQIEKNTVAIRDLIVVSRTLIDTQQATEKQMARMRSEIETDLQRLIQTVEAFLKGFQKPNGNQ